MTAEWYYAKNKQKVGPVTEAQLKELVHSGELSPTDMVWKQGTAKWMQASQVEGLIEAGPSEIVRGSVSPPLPPLPPPVPVAEWYFVNNGQQLGPVTVEQLRAWITPSDLVWKAGMPAWAAASSLKDLFPPPPTLAATPTDFDGDGPCGRCGKVFKMKFNDAVCPHCSHRMSWQDALQACAGYTGDTSVQPQPQANAQQQHLEALLDASVVCGNNGNWDGAISLINEAIGIRPDFAPAYFKRGCARVFKEDYDGAIGDIKEAIRLDPADTDYHEALAKLEQTLEQFKRKDKPGLLGSLASAAWKVMIGLAVASEVAEGAHTCFYCAMKMPLGALICPYCRRSQDALRY